MTRPDRIRCYDNVGESCDRYVVVLLDQLYDEDTPTSPLRCAVGMSERPTHPQGFGQYGCCASVDVIPGRRIAFSELPQVCQDFVLRILPRGYVEV